MVRVLTAASVASTLLALCNGQLRVNERFDAASTPMLLRRGSDHVQQPLRQVDQESATKDLPPYQAGQFTRWAQDNSTCATYGESQWTGTIDVTDERRLFYWFFDSRNDPDNDPIIIWINGGPGGSSMMGLFNEMGPCWLEPGELETEPNPWSWNNNASLLFIDQPAGVGFATVAEGSRLPTADLDGAQDFQVFLGTFFGDVFPDRAGLPIHFAAESYGGHYAPTYVDHVLRSREMDAPTAFWGDIQSLILVDALIDFGPTFLGTYELLCTDHYGAAGILNQTACDGIRRSVPECERLGASCRVSYDGYECWAMFEYCVSKIASWYQEKVDQGERNPYNGELGRDSV
jgi:cathepsin A (carboxypeptidase C)